MLVAPRKRGERSQTKSKATMKRHGNLYNQICSLENLTIAHQKARKGKINTYGVRLFENDTENSLRQLHQELTTETYKTSEYTVFSIYDPKEREIYRLPFRDRIVHHAIMNVLEPIWTNIFIQHTYSCIKGRGIHAVLTVIKRDLNDAENTQYCLKIDVKKFYPSVDHEILKNIIRKKLKDARLHSLLDGIINSAPGVPIGNYLSQFLANLYLTYFDHWIKEIKRVKYYYRYADDIVILASDKAYLHKLLTEIVFYLHTNLNLNLKGNYQVFPVDSRGIDFVGYVLHHNHTKMRKSIKKRLCRKAAKLNKKDIDTKSYKMQIAPWLGWAKHCNSRHLLKKIIKHEEIL